MSSHTVHRTSTHPGRRCRRSPERFTDPGHGPHRLAPVATSTRPPNKRAERQVVAAVRRSRSSARSASSSAYCARAARARPSPACGCPTSLLGPRAVPRDVRHRRGGRALGQDAHERPRAHRRAAQRSRAADATRQRGRRRTSRTVCADSDVGRRGVLKGAMFAALALAPLRGRRPAHRRGRRGLGHLEVQAHPLEGRASGSRQRPLRSTRSAPPRSPSAPRSTSSRRTSRRPSTRWTRRPRPIVLMVRLDPRDLKERRGPQGLVVRGDRRLLQGLHARRVPRGALRAADPPPAVPVPPVDVRPRRRRKVVFGPANRPLPQLPITVDDEGYLVAQSDFHEPIGPSYWERLK